jgi:hypothetical protein
VSENEFGEGLWEKVDRGQGLEDTC